MAIALTTSIADGPLPFGEIVGAVIIIKELIYNWDGIVDGFNAIGHSINDAWHWIKGERGWQGKSQNTDNPYKKWRKNDEDYDTVFLYLMVKGAIIKHQDRTIGIFIKGLMEAINLEKNNNG